MCIVDPRLALICAGLLLGAACGKDTGSDSDGGSTGSDETDEPDGGVMDDTDPCAGGGPPSNISTSAEAGSGDPECVLGQAAFIALPDVGGHPGIECDPWLLPGDVNCPAGQKCMPEDTNADRVWDATACVPLPAAPDDMGDPCTPPDPSDPESDPCEQGSLCWADTATTGTCVPFCTLSNPSIVGGIGNLIQGDNCILTNRDSLSIALPECNPVDAAAFCGAGQGCYPLHHGFVCSAPSGDPDAATIGEACAHVNDCEPGLLCMDGAAVPGCGSSTCCTEFCDLSGPSCSDAAADCLPWFVPGDAPLHATTDFRAVGFCGIDLTTSMLVDELDPFVANNGTSFTNGILASCDTTAAQPYDLSTFGRSLEELCHALPLCASQSEIYVEFVGTLVEQAGVSPPPGGEQEVMSGFVDVAGGSETFSESGAASLPRGHHTMEFCAYDDGGAPFGCMDQVLQVNAPLAVGVVTGGGFTGEIAGEIGVGYMPLAGRVGATLLSGMTNNGQVTVTLPKGFTFPFHGTIYSSVRVQANGGLSFGTGSAVVATNTALPHSTAPDIAVLWDDHNPAAGGGVWTYYDATKYVVSWESVRHNSTPAGLGVSFQVHLFASGRIEFHYRDTHYSSAWSSLNGGKSATIGTQRPNDTAWLQASFNTPIFGDGKKERAIALSTDECIISAMRFPAWVLCNDPELVVSPTMEVDACERTDGKVWIPSPELSTLCGWPESYRVEGWLVKSGTTPLNLQPLAQPVLIDGAAVTAAPGVHELEWYVMNGEKTVSGPYTQVITVAPSYAVLYGTAQNITYGFTAIASTGTPLNLGADSELQVSLPFAFRYYGGSYQSVWVGSNGALRFNAGDISPTNSAIPSTLATSPDVALFWDDLAPNAAGDAYTKYDAANQRFILSWEGVPHAPNVGAGSFQIHLYETGRIEFHYLDGNFGSSSYNNGRSATIGIQDHVAGLASTHFVSVSHNVAWSTMDGTAKAFQPYCAPP